MGFDAWDKQLKDYLAAPATQGETAAWLKGVNATKWDKKGLQSNFYWERTSDRRPLEIDQEPNDDQAFDLASYQADVDESVFDLPARCEGAGKCSLLSLCRAVA